MLVPNLIVCRCEEVSLAAIAASIAAGACTERQVKLATRAGMGPCQGRMCRCLVEAIVAEMAPPHPAPAGPPHRRLPARPFPLGELAAEEDLP